MILFHFFPQSIPSKYSLKVFPQSIPSKHSRKVFPQSIPAKYSTKSKSIEHRAQNARPKNQIFFSFPYFIVVPCFKNDHTKVTPPPLFPFPPSPPDDVVLRFLTSCLANPKMTTPATVSSSLAPTISATFLSSFVASPPPPSAPPQCPP